MIDLTLEVAEADEADGLLENYLRGRFSWPVVPRQGEMVDLGVAYCRVSTIYHNIPKNEIVVQVLAFTPDFREIAKNPKWEKS